jgi:hypothetical protein
MISLSFALSLSTIWTIALSFAPQAGFLCRSCQLISSKTGFLPVWAFARPAHPVSFVYKLLATKERYFQRNEYQNMTYLCKNIGISDV